MPALVLNLHCSVVLILKFRITLSVIALCFLCSPSLRAQKPKIEIADPPSVADTGTFVSPEGRFSIALPQSTHAARPMPVFIPLATAHGHYFDWDLKEGVFSAAYADFPGNVDSKMAVKILSELRARAEKRIKSYNGRIVSERQITIDENPGMELKIEFPSAYLINRIYLVSRRMYDTSALIVNQKREYEAAATAMLDSFKILSEAEAEKALTKKGHKKAQKAQKDFFQVR
jgi:hypothetical protein